MMNTREGGSYVQAQITQHIRIVIKKEQNYPEFGFHSLRHTHSTGLYEAGDSSKEIQRRLGYKTLEVTNRRYIHATDLMETQSMDIMDCMYR